MSRLMPRLRVTPRFDPTGAAKLSLGTLDYMRRLNRQRAYVLSGENFNGAELARSSWQAGSVSPRMLLPDCSVVQKIGTSIPSAICCMRFRAQFPDTWPLFRSPIGSNSHRISPPLSALLRSKPPRRMIRLTWNTIS